jgi:hypothetical protein
MVRLLKIAPVREVPHGKRKAINKRLICFSGAREGSAMLPPPRDCNRDENRMKATVRKDGKAR